jgi:hypothetical protein
MGNGHDGEERVAAGQLECSSAKNAYHCVNYRAHNDPWDKKWMNERNIGHKKKKNEFRLKAVPYLSIYIK